MLCLVELAKFDLDRDILCQKLTSRLSCSVTSDLLSSRLRVEGSFTLADLASFSEIRRIFVVAVAETPLQLASFRSQVVAVAQATSPFQLQVKTYPGVGIPAAAFKKKLAGPFRQAGVVVSSTAASLLLLEIFKESGKLFYRLLQTTSLVASVSSSPLTVVLEQPRLVEELADFIRLCSLFGLQLVVIHADHAAAAALIGQAKKICKGRLSTFSVRVVRSLANVSGLRVGFSRHARDGESAFLSFLHMTHPEPLVFVFGNDQYGLSQQSRDALDFCFSLTPSTQKPLKGNQTLAYVLGLFSASR